MNVITPHKYETLTSDKLVVSNACEKLPLATFLEKKGILTIVEMNELINRLKSK